MNSSIKVLFDSDVVEGFSVPIEVLFSDVNFVKRSNVSLVFGWCCYFKIKTHLYINIYCFIVCIWVKKEVVLKVILELVLN